MVVNPLYRMNYFSVEVTYIPMYSCINTSPNPAVCRRHETFIHWCHLAQRFWR